MSTLLNGCCEDEMFGYPTEGNKAYDNGILIPDGFENIVGLEIDWLVNEFNEKYGLDPEGLRPFLEDMSSAIGNILTQGSLIDSFGRLFYNPKTNTSLTVADINEELPFSVPYPKALNIGLLSSEQVEEVDTESKDSVYIFLPYQDKMSKMHYALTKGGGIDFRFGTRSGDDFVTMPGMAISKRFFTALHRFVSAGLQDFYGQNENFRRIYEYDLSLIPVNLVAACLIDYANKYGGGCLIDTRDDKSKYKKRKMFR